MNSSDAAIIDRVLAGETEAFRLLVDRYHDDALRYATHLLGDAADAEDAVQETFVRAFRYLASYREQDRFHGWLWRILVNRCRTLAADRARRPRPRELDGLLLVPGPADPEADLDRALLRADLSRALAQLPVEQREALLLHLAHGLSYPEVARLTGVGVSALKMRVHRACGRLRSLLGKQHHPHMSTPPRDHSSHRAPDHA